MIAALFLVGVSCVAVGFLAGAAFVGWRKRTRIPKHEHAWDQWEDMTVTEPSGNRYTAQRRRCLGCNYKEVRAVVE